MLWQVSEEVSLMDITQATIRLGKHLALMLAGALVGGKGTS